MRERITIQQLFKTTYDITSCILMLLKIGMPKKIKYVHCTYLVSRKKPSQDQISRQSRAG